MESFVTSNPWPADGELSAYRFPRRVECDAEYTPPSGTSYSYSIADRRCMKAETGEPLEQATGDFSTPSTGRWRFEQTGSRDWGQSYTWRFDALIQVWDESEWIPELIEEYWLEGDEFSFTVTPGSIDAHTIHEQPYAVKPNIPYLVISLEYNGMSEGYSHYDIAEMEHVITGPGITGEHVLFAKAAPPSDDPLVFSLSDIIPLNNEWTGSGAGFPTYTVTGRTWNTAGGLATTSTDINVIATPPVGNAYPADGSEIEPKEEGTHLFWWYWYYGGKDLIEIMDKTAALVAWLDAHPGQPFVGTRQELWDFYQTTVYSSETPGSGNNFSIPYDVILPGRAYMWRITNYYRPNDPSEYIDAGEMLSVFNANPYDLSLTLTTDIAEFNAKATKPPTLEHPFDEAEELPLDAWDAVYMYPPEFEGEKLLVWSDEGEPDHYDVYLGVENELKKIGETEEKYFVLPYELMPDGLTLHWKVVAVYSESDDLESEEWSFTCGKGIYDPEPADGAVDVFADTNRLRWKYDGEFKHMIVSITTPGQGTITSDWLWRIAKPKGFGEPGCQLYWYGKRIREPHDGIWRHWLFYPIGDLQGDEWFTWTVEAVIEWQGEEYTIDETFTFQIQVPKPFEPTPEVDQQDVTVSWPTVSWMYPLVPQPRFDVILNGQYIARSTLEFGVGIPRGTLPYGTTISWRVDSVTPFGRARGDTWEFETWGLDHTGAFAETTRRRLAAVADNALWIEADD